MPGAPPTGAGDPGEPSTGTPDEPGPDTSDAGGTDPHTADPHTADPAGTADPGGTADAATEAGAGRPRAPGRKLAAAVVLTVAGALACALVLAPRTALSSRVLFGTVTVEGRGAGGTTTVELPPAGSVRAGTHDGPAAVTLRLDSVDLDALERAPDHELDPDRLAPDARAGLTGLVRDWAVRVTWVAAALGVLCALVAAALVAVPRRTAAGLCLLGAVCGAAGWAAPAARAWASFDPGAFDQPRYDGALRFAPQVLGAARGTADGWVSVRDSLDQLTGRLESLARSTTGGPDPAQRPDDVVLLHVSDIHLNPLGMELVRRLTEQFGPDAVLDTGDLTSFGLTPDEGMFAALAQVDVPYYLVPGNHDSAEAVAAAAATGRVQVLDGRVVDVRGLRVAGVSDPTHTPAGAATDPRELARAYQAQLPAIAELWRTERPDLLAVHNPDQARAVAGTGATVAAGHIHRHLLEHDGADTLAVVGSTGAGGLGALGATDPAPYQAELLRFRRAAGRFELWAVDRIEISADALLETGPGTSVVERLDPRRAPAGDYLSPTPTALATPEPSLAGTAPTTSTSTDAAPAGPSPSPAPGAEPPTTGPAGPGT